MLIGELLLEAGAITREQLEIARRNQELYGERLGTNLVELGFITEATLSAVLSQQHRLPSVSPGVLDRVAPDVIALMSKDLVAKYRVCPIRRDGDRVFIAVSDPNDTKGQAALRQALPFDLRWMIAADLSITNALERYYGVQRKLRDAKKPGDEVVTELDADQLVEEVAIPDPFAPTSPDGEEPGMVAIEMPLLAEVLTGALHAHATQKPATAAAPVHAPLAPETPRLSLSAFAARLVGAGAESDLSDATLAYLAQDFRRVVMVTLRGDQFVAWRALGGGLTDEGVRVFSVPKADLPMCMRALDDGVPRVQKGADMVGKLSALLGDPGNETALILPVRCSGRPVACFVAVGGNESVEWRFNDFLLVARKLDLTLQILVLRKRVLE